MKFKVRVLLLIIAVTLLVLGIGLSTLAASTVTITEIEGPRDPVFSPCIAFKPDEDSVVGTFTKSDGALEVTYTISQDMKTLNWSSNIPVSHVFVKGGSGGNDYHYTPATTEGSGLGAPSGKDISHVTFYYCPPVTLIVYKDIIDEDERSLSENSEHKDVSFAVYVNDTLYSVSASEPLVLTGLTPGTFTVTESTTLPPNYSYESGNEVITINRGSGTVTLTNRYTPEIPETVTLVVRKNIIDRNGNSLNESNVHKNIDFDVTVNGTSYVVSASSPLTLTNLTPGAFTVNESTSLPANYSYVSGNETITVNSGEGTVTITNRYLPRITNYVTLIVKKNIIDVNGNSLNEDTAHKNVNFTVNVNGTPYTVSAASQLVLTGLRPGTFAVNESTTMPANYSYVDGNETVAVNSGTVTVTVTNRYIPPPDPETVTLVIQKRITDAAGNSLNNDKDHKDVKFTVTVNGKSYTVSVAKPLVLTGLTPGSFTVKEAMMPLKYTYISGNETRTVNSGTATFTIMNRYQKELPITSGADILIIILGALLVFGGLLIRKRIQPTK